MYTENNKRHHDVPETRKQISSAHDCKSHLSASESHSVHLKVEKNTNKVIKSSTSWNNLLHSYQSHHDEQNSTPGPLHCPKWIPVQIGRCCINNAGLIRSSGLVTERQCPFTITLNSYQKIKCIGCVWFEKVLTVTTLCRFVIVFYSVC